MSLTAPKSGDMAGILIAEDRRNPVGNAFEIYSNNARNLLGTIYLPQGRLHVAANNPVSDQSPIQSSSRGGSRCPKDRRWY